MANKVVIVSRVDVQYNEADLARLVKAEIESENPSVQVNEVTFERKLNPNRIAVNVDAVVRGSAPTEMQGTGIDSPVETDEPEVKEEEVAATVADIFGED